MKRRGQFSISFKMLMKFAVLFAILVIVAGGIIGVYYSDFEGGIGELIKSSAPKDVPTIGEGDFKGEDPGSNGGSGNGDYTGSSLCNGELDDSADCQTLTSTSSDTCKKVDNCEWDDDAGASGTGVVCRGDLVDSCSDFGPAPCEAFSDYGCCWGENCDEGSGDEEDPSMCEGELTQSCNDLSEADCGKVDSCEWTTVGASGVPACYDTGENVNECSDLGESGCGVLSDCCWGEGCSDESSGDTSTQCTGDIDESLECTDLGEGECKDVSTCNWGYQAPGSTEKTCAGAMVDSCGELDNAGCDALTDYGCSWEG